MEPDAPQVHAPGNLHVHPNLLDTTAFSRGDVDAALARSAHVIEQTFRTQPVEPAFLEPEACLALPQGKGVKVFSQSQGSTFDHSQIARIVEYSRGRGRDRAGVQRRSVWRQGRTVHPSADRAGGVPAGTPGQDRSDAQAIHAASSQAPSDDAQPYTVGADAEGHLLAVRARIVGDVGGYAGTSAKCLLRAACHSCGPYRVPNVDVEAKAVFTNNPTSGAMRGFGTNQAHFAMEGIMDMLAERVGIDGYDIRERNILNPGDAFATGQIMRRKRRGIAAQSRSGQGHLQEREIRRHRLRHQEHRHRQRHHR